MLDFLKPAKDAMALAGERLSSLTVERKTVAEERDRVAALPLARADLIAELEAWIDQDRSRYLNDLQTVLSPLSARADRPINRVVPTVHALLTRDGAIRPDAFLVGLLAESVKAALVQALESLTLQDDDGITREERAIRLAELDARLLELDDSIKEFRAEMVRSGLRPDSINIPTEAQIKAHFPGGIPSGTPYDKGIRELFEKLNPWV